VRSLAGLKRRVAALRAQLAARLGFNRGRVDSITTYLRSRITAGVGATPTTPEAIESAKASLTARLAEAGRAARAECEESP